MLDRDQKGRAAQTAGEQNGYARLTETDVRAIRARVEAGETQASLGREYGVSKPCINSIVRRKRWKHGA